jgi:hypothetical protein
MIAILGSLFVLGLAAGVADAGDLCLDATDPSNPPTINRPVIILRGFKFPKKNKCKSFAGVVSTSIPSVPSAVTGAACTRFDGTGVTFTIHASLAPTIAGFRSGTELRYSALVIPTGSSEGTGAISSFTPTQVSNGPVVAFECHNAFPDNL